MTTSTSFAQQKQPKRGPLRAALLASCLGMATLAAPLMAPGPAAAQDLHSPAIKVNDETITNYERSQRIAFLRLLRAPGDVAKLAEDQLINEALQRGEARRMGIEVDEEAVLGGMEEFASRGNLDVETFLKLIAQGGISAESFRDFVRSGLTWREVARAKFIPQVNVTKVEVERAFAKATPELGEKVLLTEIVLPAPNDASRKASTMRADRLRQIEGKEAFAEAAKRFSVAPSRLANGERDWIDMRGLPPEIAGAVKGLRAGQISRPINTEDGVALYMLRDRDTVKTEATATLLDYAAFLMPGGRSEANIAAAQKLKGEVKSCDELYPIARALPEEALVREELPQSQVPASYRAELAKLDPGEISTALTTSGGGALVFLMLCNRRNDVPKSVTRESILNKLRDQRIGSLANGYLTDLRADAHIEYYR